MAAGSDTASPCGGEQGLSAGAVRGAGRGLARGRGGFVSLLAGGPAPGALCTGRCGHSRAGRLRTLPGAASTRGWLLPGPRARLWDPAGTYLLQPTSLPYCTAAASPWRKASCRPGTAPSPSSPRSRSPRRETGGEKGGGSPPAPRCPPRCPPCPSPRRYRGGR